MTRDLLPLVLDPIVTALKDDDDDVRAVAASALLPVAESLVTFAPSRVSIVVEFMAYVERRNVKA